MKFRNAKALVITLTAAAVLAGCGMTPFTVNNGNALYVPPVQQGHFMSGLAHGGYGAITGATVTLWAAGTSTGYGQGATEVAQTTTDSNGNFSFDTAGASPCTVGQYLYITVTGGNPGANGTNMASALMAALPNPCVTGTGATATGSQSVVVNEVSTVAAVWSLQQFMSIQAGTTYAGGSTPVWNIGAPATNLVGLNNAFATTAQFMTAQSGYASTGVAGSTVVQNTVQNPGAPAAYTYSTTIAPDIQRINAVADILAACVDTTDVTPGTTPSAMCTSIFSNTYASGETAPIDTIQAAYKIATAPAGISKAGLPYSTAWKSDPNFNTSWAQYLCGTFVTGTAPFPSTLACSAGSTSTTVDYNIGIRWTTQDNDTTYGSAATGCTDSKNIDDIVFDATGNVWGSPAQTYSGATGCTNATGTANFYMLEWSPDGRLLQANPQQSITVPTTSLTLTAHDTNTTAIGPFTVTPTSNTESWVLNSTNQTNNGAIDFTGNYWATDFASTFQASGVGGSTTYYTSFLAKMTPATNTTCPFIPCTTATTSTAGTISALVGPAYPSALAFDGLGNMWLGGNWANVGNNSAKFALFMLPPVPVGGAPTYSTQNQATTSFSSNNINDIAVDGIGGQTGQFGSTSSVTTGWIGHTAWAALNSSSATEIYRATVTTATKATATTLGNVLDVISYAVMSGSTNSKPYHLAVDGSTTNPSVWIGEGGKGTGSLVKFSVYTMGGATGSNAGSFTASAASNVLTLSGLPSTGTYNGTTFLNTLFQVNTSICTTGWTTTTSYNGVCGYIQTGNVPVTGNPAGFAVSEKPNPTLASSTETTGTVSTYLPTAAVQGTASSTNTGNTNSGGLQAPSSIAIDGIGNVWVANAASSIAGIGEYTPTGVAISPTTAVAIPGVEGFNANYNGTNAGGTIQKISIDPSGNVFINANNSYIQFLAGAAAPVITPTVMATTSGASAIASWSASGTTYTFTTVPTISYTVGDTAFLYGFTTTTGFNYLSAAITAVTSNSFTVTLASGPGGTGNTEVGYVIDYTQPGRLATRP